MRLPLAPVLAVSLGILSVAPTADAQDAANLARAEALFNDGTKLLEAGSYAEACPKLADSQRLVRGVGVTLYLGECYERLGKTASAWAQFRLAESLASTKGDKRANVAHDRAVRLEAQMPAIQITVATPSTPGLEVTLDGSLVARSEWGTAEPVDPGPHTVKATAPQKQPWQTTVTIPSQKQTIPVNVAHLLDVGEASPTTAPPVPPIPPPPSPSVHPAVHEPPPPPVGETSPPPGRVQRILGFGGMGLGVVGVGLGTAFGLAAESKFKQSDSEKGGCIANMCGQPGLNTRATGLTFATLSTVGFVVGGLGLAGGIVLYFTAPKATATTTMGIVPSVGPHDGALLLRGAF
jgi:hypothetical protein